MEPDVYFKKVVQLQHGGQALEFRVSQDLFSSHEVDVGTRRLLRSLPQTDFRKVLDLGCGYGPLGLTLKKIDEGRLVHMVDRDALAVEYAHQNAALNRLAGVEVYGSLGYDDVTETDFDLIVCNIPAKAGETVIASFLREAQYYLKPGGLVAVVVIAPLESTVAEILDAPEIDLVYRNARAGHAVFHYRFSAGSPKGTRPVGSALDRGLYRRGDMTVSLPGQEFPVQTALGLPEFDTLSYASVLLIEGMRSIRRSAVKRAIVFNPGQGHVSVALWKLAKPSDVVLVGRDLLSLRHSRDNLLLNGCQPEHVSLSHQVGVVVPGAGPADLIGGILREEEGSAAIAFEMRRAAEQLAPGGTILLAASSTAVTRLVKVLQSEKFLRIAKRKRSKGQSLLVLNRR